MSPRADFRLEEALWRAGIDRVAGTDEAGRGCLAGPVVAAAVILEPATAPDGLEDSKALSPAARAALAPRIREHALAWSIGVCDPGEIDRMNILKASLEAMRRAVAGLGVAPDHVLVDGNRLVTGLACPATAVVRGDAASRSIAAASILAKTVRDRMMEELAERHPGYGWERNRGYPTPDHFDALERLGPSPVHRFSFSLRRRERQGELFAP